MSCEQAFDTVDTPARDRRNWPSHYDFHYPGDILKWRDISTGVFKILDRFERGENLLVALSFLFGLLAVLFWLSNKMKTPNSFRTSASELMTMVINQSINQSISISSFADLTYQHDCLLSFALLCFHRLFHA